MLTSILDADPGIEVVATASDPIFGLMKIKKLNPDVITSDLEMPRMDGLTFLKELMAEKPKPVVMISSYTAKNCHSSLRALELGAVEVIQKPGGNVADSIQELSAKIITAVKTAARARIPAKKAFLDRPRSEKELSSPKPLASAPAIAGLPVATKHLIDELIPLTGYKAGGQFKEKIIVIGASTGGTIAVGDILKNLPPTLPGILIVQHIPPEFTGPFADRLDSISRIKVSEARNGARVKRGTALVAPGDSHMLLEMDYQGYFVKTLDAFPINRHKPSVDVLFRTAANISGPHAIGVILTGMNDDGARAMKDMHDNGACTIAQDEESCVVFGMPKNAIDTGGVDIVAPLENISEILIEKSNRFRFD